MDSKRKNKSKTENSKKGAPPEYILTLIAAIINYIFAGILFFFILIASLILLLVGFSDAKAFFPGFLIFFIFILATLFVLGMGILLNVSANKMRCGNSEEIKFWSIVTIIVGVISLGGISGILALIGGILGLVKLSDKNKP